MPLDIQSTVLASAPYFETLAQAEANHYHQVVFRPAVAVQARELNDLQGILQNQIERFGSNIFKDGSIVEGCSVEFIADLEFIGIADQFNNNSALAQNDPSLINAVIIGGNTGCQALLVGSQTGFIRQSPGRFFIRYTAPGTNGDTKFLAGETLNVYSANTSYIEDIVLTVVDPTGFAGFDGQTLYSVQAGNTANVLASGIIVNVNTTANTITINNIERRYNANDVLVLASNTAVTTNVVSVAYDTSNLIGSINSLTTNTDGVTIATNDISGYAYGAYVSEGVVFNKGYFITVDPQTIVVNPSNNNPNGFLLGFQTTESVVTETTDSSLNDNALGYSNFNAPGAHRLKLSANLVSVAANSLSNGSIFFPIVEFSNSGVIFQKTDPQYAALGDAIATRTYEEAGHFIVRPFLVSSNTNPADDQSILLNVNPGLAYVKGSRIELLNNLEVNERRGTDTLSFSSQIVSMSYGNYVQVEEVRGYFPTDQSISVSLIDTAQHGISNNDVSTSSAVTGNVIGTANMRELIPSSAPQGTPNSTMSAYLFNIKMSNSSLNFANVKAIAYTSGSANAFADLVSSNLVDSSFTPMIFSLGATAVKSLVDGNNVAASEFYYHGANTTASLTSAGVVTFKVPSGGGILGFTDGSTTSIGRVSLYLTNQAISANVSTAVTVYSNSVLTATGLGNLFYAGEVVGHGANSYLVSQVIDADTIKVANTTVASSAQTVFRVHEAGSLVPIDGTNRTLTWNANNQATIDLGASYTNAPVAATVRFLALENQAQQLQKNINRSTTVLFSTANTGTDVGPWNLGIPDVLAVTGIYNTIINGSVIQPDLTNNLINDFVVDNGQRDGFYDHASLKLSSSIAPSKYTNKTLLALVDHFTPNNTTGEGFFSVDSYPVDDTIGADANTTIKTAEIQSFYSTSQGKPYNLRDCIDFRPYKVATANIGNQIGNATLNPSATNAFNSVTTQFTPYPGENFQCNFTNYIGRKDVLTLTPDGTFVIVEGGPSTAPRTPTYPSDSLAIANINVPPYPTLPANEVKQFPNAAVSVLTISLISSRRYTMKDISSLDQRISQLEYYTTLNALESAAATQSVIGPSGTDMFKNGIFVDPLNNHSFGRVDVPQYRIAVDETHGFGRPFFYPQFIDLQLDNSQSNNVIQIGETVMLQFTEQAFINEQYATDSRTLSGSPPTYYGTLILHPDRWSQVEAQAGPVAVTSVDAASAAYAAMEIPPLCANFGWWRQDITASSQSLSTSNSSQSTLRDKTSVGSGSMSTYSLSDTTTQSVTIQAYLTPREIAFSATGLKPYTTFYVYVDKVDMTLLAAPGTIANSAATDDKFVLRSAPWGSPITTNSRGEVSGKISLPAFTFNAGKHTVTLLDTQIDSVTQNQVSGAAAMFEVDIIYQAPPPPANPPAPQKPPVDPAPTPPSTPPTASFTFTGNTTVSSGNPVLTFKDKSVAGSNTIVSWSWNFGDGSSSALQNPPAHTYNMTSSTLPVNVVLTVTDAAGKKASYTKALTLSKLPPAPAPKPVTPPPLPTTQILAFIGGTQSGANTVFKSGTPDGAGVANGVGSVGVYFNLVPSTSYTGATVNWTVTVNSGNTLSNTFVNLYSGNTTPTQTPAPLGAGNTQLYCMLVDTRAYNSSNPPLRSNITVKASYVLANSSTVNTSTNYVLTVQPQVPPSSGGGGGGCVEISQFTPLGKQIVEYKAEDEIAVCLHKTMSNATRVISRAYQSLQPCYKLTTESGAWVIASASTPMEPRDGQVVLLPDMLHKEIPVRRGDNEPVWEKVVAIEDVGERIVNRISVRGNDLCYWAGGEPGVYISTHNINDGHQPYKKF